MNESVRRMDEVINEIVVLQKDRSFLSVSLVSTKTTQEGLIHDERETSWMNVQAKG
jgi:hypothetical protein